jgi:hypothetical protein
MTQLYESGTKIPCGGGAFIEYEGEDELRAASCLCPGYSTVVDGIRFPNFGAEVVHDMFDAGEGCPPSMGGNNQSLEHYMEAKKAQESAPTYWVGPDTVYPEDAEEDPEAAVKDPAKKKKKKAPVAPPSPIKYAITPGPSPVQAFAQIPWWVWALLAGGTAWFIFRRKG